MANMTKTRSSIRAESMKGDDGKWMALALEEAKRGYGEGEVPVGAVAVREGKELAAAHNLTIKETDPTAHAEIVALRRAAAAIGNHRMPGVTLYTTLEPCMMCAGALVEARIERLVYGAADPKRGFMDELRERFARGETNHEFAIEGGVLEEACSSLLERFFREKREKP